MSHALCPSEDVSASSPRSPRWLSWILFVAMLAAMTAGLASAQDAADVIEHNARVAEARNPGVSSAREVITVGRGDRAGRVGQINVFDATHGGSFRDAVQDAIAIVDGAGGGVVEILPGNYSVDGALTLANTPVEIRLASGANLTIGHSGATGLATLSASNCSIVGRGKITVDTWVNDQVAIRATSSYPRLESFRMDFAMASGETTSNPMVAIKLDTTLEPRITNVEINPDKGVRALHWLYGHGGVVKGLKVRNTSTIGYGGSENAVPRRGCWEAVRALGIQFATFEDCLTWGLGTASTDELNESWIIGRDSDQPGTDPLVPDGAFQGSITIKHCTWGFIACPTQLKLRGVLDWFVDTCEFNSSAGVIDAAGEGALFLDTETGASTGETGICGVGQVKGCIFEGCALSAASAIQAKRCKKVIFAGNNFHGGTCAKFVNVNIDDSSTLMFRDNYFDGDEANTQWGIGFDSPSLLFLPRLISIRDNAGDGLLYGVCPGRISVTYATGASNWANGTQYDDGSINNFVSPVSNHGNPPIIVLPASVLTLPADLDTIAAIPGSGSDFTAANKALHCLAAHVNRMSSMNEFAMGLSALSNNLITDSSGGTADGSIVDITDMATLRDDIAELAAAINAFQNPQKTVSLETTRRRYLTTMVDGQGASNAFAALNISAVSGSANSLGVVAADATSVASAKAFFATIAQAFNENVRHVSASSNVSWDTSAGN